VRTEFDAEKDSANRTKHGVSLAFGADVLADERRLDVLDVRFDYGEERFVCYGMVRGRIWVCIFARRGEACRIVSVRRANERERQRYRDTAR
jgi:uncharacterized protein